MVRYEGWRGYGRALPVEASLGYGLPTEEERARVEPWTCWTWRAAEMMFLERFELLTRKPVS